MSRFFVDKSAVLENQVHITNQDDIKHISKVLRLKEGDYIDVSDGVAYEYRVQLLSIDKNLVTGQIHDKQGFSKEPQLKVSLYQGIPKQGKMETIIQKNVELGVHRIIPVFTARTVVTDNGNFDNKRKRWQKISDEAVKQCKRGIIPQVEPPVSFQEMLDTIEEEHDFVLFLYENEAKTTLKEALRNGVCGREQCEGKIQTIALIIGPEGGFSQQEAEALQRTSAYCATLGKTILRTETAGMAALAMVMYELEL